MARAEKPSRDEADSGLAAPSNAGSAGRVDEIAVAAGLDSMATPPPSPEPFRDGFACDVAAWEDSPMRPLDVSQPVEPVEGAEEESQPVEPMDWRAC